MKSVLLYAFALLFAGIATTLLIVNRHAPSTTVVGGSIFLYVLALCLTGFASTVREALAELAPYLAKNSTGGGNGGKTP